MVSAASQYPGLDQCVRPHMPRDTYDSVEACLQVGRWVGDVVITREEIRGLMEGRLCVDAPALGRTRLTDWIQHHKESLGRRYTSEMARRVDRVSEYRSN